MISAGPLPLVLFIVLAAAAIAVAVGARLARGLVPRPWSEVASHVTDALLVGLVAARVGFVLLWWQSYLEAPWSILRIGDGGFIPWVGIVAGLALAFWRLRAKPVLRKPVLIGFMAGIAAWALLAGTVLMLQRSMVQMPEAELSLLDHTPVQLHEYTGRPMVVNLWATWCPPCRREMPVLAAAQHRFPGVNFVLVNQGESPIEVLNYLEQSGLSFENMLLDPYSRVMQEVGARGLPTTLFFHADGRLADTHMGELTEAALAHTLQQRFNVKARTSSAASTPPSPP
ncbi:TlpA disulfide reductase family protein [Alkalisalibacterium limincola]|uniref:TlpA family protein disulfide reductase n=1 Tax=Alkalisalibacterium limincola TaxID=2699169 RepID=A0A5C8KW71_9GAMM|nr:TlpA disulfide reductase family protein [Alkalisalibacterium limincola]TXK64329.1 TlpA family protein disulfide reductase [Alkalisalibacterium limincola]